LETTLAAFRHIRIDVRVCSDDPVAISVADPVNVAFKFFYVGLLIVNPPIIGGRTLVPAPDTNGNIAYTFTQPAEPCDGLKCKQEIFRIDKNPDSCWIYEDISLENVEQAPGFYFVPVQTSEALRLHSLGNVNGRVFTFRARVSSRCAPTS
jgi:hypothetical protein